LRKEGEKTEIFKIKFVKRAQSDKERGRKRRNLWRLAQNPRVIDEELGDD